MKYIKKYENKKEYKKYFLLSTKKDLLIFGYNNETYKYYVGDLLYTYDGKLNDLYVRPYPEYNHLEKKLIKNLIVYTSDNLNDIFNKIEVYWKSNNYNL